MTFFPGESFDLVSLRTQRPFRGFFLPFKRLKNNGIISKLSKVVYNFFPATLIRERLILLHLHFHVRKDLRFVTRRSSSIERNTRFNYGVKITGKRKRKKMEAISNGYAQTSSRPRVFSKRGRSIFVGDEDEINQAPALISPATNSTSNSRIYRK